MTVIVVLGLVLVPGFEPGSTDRESVMMDRTTLHERGSQRLAVRLRKQWVESLIYDFIHFHFHPSGLLPRLICGSRDIPP